MSDRIIWTPSGIYVPAHLADTIRAAAEPAPPYGQPDPWPGTIGNYFGTPIYIMRAPIPKPPKRWWVRAWRRITRRRDVKP